MTKNDLLSTQDFVHLMNINFDDCNFVEKFYEISAPGKQIAF